MKLIKEGLFKLKINCLLALPNHRISILQERLQAKLSNFDLWFFPFPVLDLEPHDKNIQDFNWAGINNYDYVILVSEYSANLFLTMAKTEEVDIQSPICTVGPSVSAVIEKYNKDVHHQATQFNIKKLVSELGKKEDLSGKKVLIACADHHSDDEAYQKLVSLGAEPEYFIVYRSKALTYPSPYHVNALHSFQYMNADLNLIFLTSPNGVKSFANLMKQVDFELDDHDMFSCLGPKTSQLTKKLFPGYQVLFDEHQEYSYNGMAKTITDYLSQSQKIINV